MSLHVKYLLVGGGVASSEAAAAIRLHDRHGAIMLIAQEPIRPYHRPPLSKDYLLGRRQRPSLFTQSPDWFDNQHVELHTACRAVRVDVARQSVMLDNGQEISYDRLLLATGATPRPLEIPGAQMPNVYYFRTVDDADRLHHAVEKARTEGRRHDHGRGIATVIGGELLAVELAATLTRMGLSVDLVTAGAYPWQTVAGETTGRFIARYLQAHGVRVHAQKSARSLEGDGRVQRVVFDDGEIPTDMVVAAIGTKVNRELISGTSIDAERAILADDHARANVPNVYAAGDCSAIFDPLFGKHRQFEHWEHARATGRLAGTNMAGGDERFAAVTHFFTEAFGLSATGWGEPRLVERRLIRGQCNVESPRFLDIGVAGDGRVAQVISVGPRDASEPPDATATAEMVRRRLQVGGLEEQLKDPTVDLESLLRASDT
mgnify:CR=1 FL=1